MNEKYLNNVVYGCTAWIVTIFIVCVLLVLQVIVGQWLFGIFGWRFSFCKMFVILLAIKFVFGRITYCASRR